MPTRDQRVVTKLPRPFSFARAVGLQRGCSGRRTRRHRLWHWRDAVPLSYPLESGTVGHLSSPPRKRGAEDAPFRPTTNEYWRCLPYGPRREAGFRLARMAQSACSYRAGIRWRCGKGDAKPEHSRGRQPARERAGHHHAPRTPVWGLHPLAGDAVSGAAKGIKRCEPKNLAPGFKFGAYHAYKACTVIPKFLRFTGPTIGRQLSRLGPLWVR
jgi:hypothetical protein